MSRSRRANFHQRTSESQSYGTTVAYPIKLSDEIREKSCEVLNQILADTIVLRDMYKKHHWQVSGPTFYSLHLLFDKHYAEQTELVDTLAERIQLLGGVALAMPQDVAEVTRIPRVPKGREEPAVQISRLLEAHECILEAARPAARETADSGDDGTNDILISDVIRTNEMQVWFLAEHLYPSALVEVGEGPGRQPPSAGAPSPTPH